MLKKLLFSLALLPAMAHAQVITFETLSLPGNDTFYVNPAHHLQDDGFTVGAVHFPYLYDTSFHGWSGGFVYSNRKDSVTSGYSNMYAAKAGGGYGGSDKYLVFSPGYSPIHNLYVPQNPNDTVENTRWFAAGSIYVTNSTYAYNSMKNGDAFAKKFGGATGNDPDWFRLSILGYRHQGGHSVATGHVDFYLADFRTTNNAQDYIIRDWTRVDLTPIGTADSLDFQLSSSDTGAFGMNTPAYFCMDNLSVNFPTSISERPMQAIAKVYPSPANAFLTVELNDASIRTVSIVDVSGRLIAAQPAGGATKLMFNTATFAPGVYMLRLEGPGGTSSVRFSKQ